MSDAFERSLRSGNGESSVALRQRGHVGSLLLDSRSADFTLTSPMPGARPGLRPGSGLSQRSAASDTISCVSNRLYSKATLSSAAKSRCGPNTPVAPITRPTLAELASRVVKTSDFCEGQSVSQLITLEISSGDDRWRKVQRRRSLPNIGRSVVPMSVSATATGPRAYVDRRGTVGGSGGIGGPDGEPSGPGANILSHRRYTIQSCVRRLGSDGSSECSSPTRTDSPSPPPLAPPLTSPAPLSHSGIRHFRRSCGTVESEASRDKTPPPFQSTLRRNSSGGSGTHRDLDNSRVRCGSVRSRCSSDVNKRVYNTLCRSDRVFNHARSVVDSQSNHAMVGSNVKRWDLSGFLVDSGTLNCVRKNIVYFPARNLRKINGKSFMDLSQILEEHSSDCVDAAPDGSLPPKSTDGESVWLVHKDGFSMAYVLSDENVPSLPGKVLVRLQSSSEVLEVDEDDLEKAGDPSDQLTSDLTRLRHLNESSALDVLRQRFGCRLSYTHAGAGTTLLLLNPVSSVGTVPITDRYQMRRLFEQCRADPIPPHIYATAQSVYRSALCQRRDQAVLVLGRSGAGKTHCCHQILHYLVAESTAVPGSNVTSNGTRPLTVERLEAVWTLLEAFGNCRTGMNTSASRFVSVYTLQLEPSGQLASGSLQLLMLERFRVVRRPEGESNFHIFHYLLAGCDDQLRQQLQLHDPLEPNSFVTPLPKEEERHWAVNQWLAVQAAVATLQIKSAECEAIWSVLAAIYHLGAAGVCRAAGSVDQYQFASASAASRAAHLLGVGVDELSRAVLTSDSASNLKRAVSGRQLATPAVTSRAAAAGGDGDGFDALEAFVAGLYAHLVTALLSLINRCISANVSHRHTNSVLIVDSPGLQNPADCGRQTGASLDDFCYNYVQERLQLLFHELTCTNLRDNYAREQVELSSPVEVDYSAGLLSSAALVSTLDRQPSDAATASSSNASSNQLPVASVDSCERRGMLWLLHEAALQPDITDTDFLHAVCNMHCSNGDGPILTAGPGDTCLTVNHMSATNPVTYDVTGWVASARETAASRRSALLLLESRRECVSVLFVSARAALGVASLSGSVAGLDSGALLLLRSASMRRTFSASSALTSRHSSRPLLAKQQLDGLMERLRRCCVRFVHCFLPQTGTAAATGPQKPPNDPPSVDVPLLRSQFRGAQLLDTLRIYKQGYPEHMVFAEFYRLFSLLVPPSAELPTKLSLHGDQKMALQHLLTQLELDPLCYRVGVTKIFLRPNVLAELECRRDERLRDSIVRFQSVCRGYLARKRFNQLKVQNMALHCVQRNVRLYLAVRSWSWWRLMNKITPLLDVHRTEQQLRSATEELSKLRVRLDKCEEARDGYKQERDTLEGKLGEMMGELQEERHTAAVATQRLQAEQVEKQQLQRQLSEAQSEFERMCMLNEQLEAELVTQSVTDGGQSTTDGQFDLEQDSGAATYRRKWEFTVRELEFAKKRMQQQHEDDEEQLMAVRKQLERKLESAVEQADEQRQLVAQLKRKVARLSSEAGDQKVHLDEQVSRNNVLERRQRKFDSDMQTLEDKLKREKQSRERISQEKDQLQSEVYSVNNEMAALRLEMSMCEEKAAQLRRELEVVQSADQLSDDEAAQLRRSRLELQRLCDEREQQLEDAAGQTSLLEQAKLRLEMCLQQARQMHRSELAQKDEELEELRASLGKKVKALECQLEVEHDERSTLVRDKHELERRVIALGECSLTSDTRQQEAVQRLRRQLKRTRALLADSQLQLERGCGEGNGGKAQLRQLRNQLEDAEFAAAAAARGRHAVETELQEVQLAAEEAQRSRAEAEARATAASRQLTQLQNQLDEQDDELQEVMKKYKSCVAQLSCDQLTMTEQSSQLDQLNSEVTQLRQQLSEVTARCQQLAGDSGSRDDQRRLELRLRELESRLEFESAGRQRIERQAVRLREEVQQSGQEASQCRERELSCSDQLKKLQRQLRDVREELAESKRHETDASQQLRTLTKQLEHSEAEAVQNRSDLRLALKRIADLQNAIQGDVESEELSDSEDSLSDGDSAHDDDDLDSFLSARLPSSLLLSVPTPAATSLENGSSALSPDSACSNNNNNSNNSSERSNGNSKHTDPPDPQ